MTRKRTTIIPGKEVCPGYKLAEDGRTIDYTGPRAGAHYCGHAYERRVAGVPVTRYPTGYRWAVWQLGGDPTSDSQPERPCATCGAPFTWEACRVKLVALRHGGHDARMEYAAERASYDTEDVHHVGCVNWAAWYRPWQRGGMTGASRRRTVIERQGILGLLESPCRVTLAEQWRHWVDDLGPNADRSFKLEPLGMTLGQLELFYNRSDAAEAVAA